MSRGAPERQGRWRSLQVARSYIRRGSVFTDKRRWQAQTVSPKPSSEASAATPPLPAGYPQLLEDLKRAVRTARMRAHQRVDTELLQLYASIGRAILDRQHEEGWGTKVLDRLAVDLRAEFPDMRGLSWSNLLPIILRTPHR